MKNIINKFQSFSKSSFISLNSYFAKTTGEVANHVINVNISIMSAKLSDLEKLKNITEIQLAQISEKSKIALETCKVALAELLTSAEKNVSANIEDRTAQSQAQTDAYIFITPAIRLHKETLALHIFGQAISKKVLVEGTYKTVNSSDKTLAKKAIKKHLDLRAEKFRDFIIENTETVKVQGDTIIIA
jgi:hypothetical protein